MLIPTELVPKCPVCGGAMEMNLRCDDTFVEDDGWRKASERYREFLDRHKTGRILYWEHYGMMDIPKYNRQNKIKRAEYERFGIVPWDNLIITYDMSGGNIDAKIIDAMINGWLL